MNKPLTLYLCRNVCSMAPHIALLEAGADFSTVHIDLEKGEQHTPEYRRINPRGYVPALKVGDEVLVENLAILVWIARTWPDARLLPAGTPEEEAQILSYLSWCTGTLHSVFGRLFKPGYLVSGDEAVESLKEQARTDVQKHFTEIEARLADREWAFGEFSIVDTFLFVCYHWATELLGLDVSAFPSYRQHYERMLQRPAVARMLEAERELARAA